MTLQKRTSITTWQTVAVLGQVTVNSTTPTTLASAESVVSGTTTAEHKRTVLRAPTITTGYVFTVALVLDCSGLL